MTLYEEYLKSLGFPENIDDLYLQEFNIFNRVFDERGKSVSMYSWAILTENVISQLKKYGPFLEIGSGNGYWAYEFKKRDINIIATDPLPKNNWTDTDFINGEAALNKYDDGKHTLLLCWPEYNKDWAYKTLNSFKGNTVVYVGEDGGGCTADEQFHKLLHDSWERIDKIEIPQWPGVHDIVSVYRRDDIHV